MDYDVVIFLVQARSDSNIKVICDGYNREDAKRNAQRWIGENPDNYIVTPLSNKGDRIKLDMTLRA